MMKYDFLCENHTIPSIEAVILLRNLIFRKIGNFCSDKSRTMFDFYFS